VNTPVYRNATLSDWTNIAALLESAGLPLDGARDHLDGFVVATRDDRVVGCAGLERRPTTGLLRSVAVSAGARGAGIGEALVRQVLARARAAGLGQVVLLTETAREYFPRFGFREAARAEAPAEVLESVEFKTACPDSAAMMLLDL
jgi:N-acetylglutamate synthase-like GNAT family acetyltransferase